MSPFQATSQAIIQLAVEAFTAAPHLTPDQKKTRTEAVVCGIMAFLPSDPVQTLLASQAIGHHLSLMDTFRDIGTQALSPNMAVRMRMAAATQTRMVLSLAKEIRATRKEVQALADAEIAASAPPPPAIETPEPPPPEPPADDATFEAHLKDFQDAFAATAQLLEETKALDKPTTARARDLLTHAVPSAHANPARRVSPTYHRDAA